MIALVLAELSCLRNDARKNGTKSLLCWEQDGGAPVRPSPAPKRGANPVSIFYSESFPVGIGQKGVDLKKLQPFC